jgi:hypothetical protein
MSKSDFEFCRIFVEIFIFKIPRNINDSGESIKNNEYFLEFEAKFEKLLDTEQGAREEPTCEKNQNQKISWTVLLHLYNSTSLPISFLVVLILLKEEYNNRNINMSQNLRIFLPLPCLFSPLCALLKDE